LEYLDAHGLPAPSMRELGAYLMDVVNVLATFTIGHTLAEVGRTPGHEGSEPDLTRTAPTSIRTSSRTSLRSFPPASDSTSHDRAPASAGVESVAGTIRGGSPSG
jgi:hypothetical protein